MIIYYVGNIPVSDELYHHGIRGQKWGIRRYQNFDGSLTPAGRERYGGNVESVSSNKLKRQYARNSNILVGSSKNSEKTATTWNRRIGKHSRPNEWHEELKKDRRGTLMKYFEDMAGARLRDMGYDDTEKGRRYLMAQPWFTTAWSIDFYPDRKAPAGADVY